MSDDVVLRPSVARWLGVSAGCCAFVAAGVAFVVWPGSFDQHLGRTLTIFGGWASIGFFGLGILLCLANLAPGSGYLRLTSTGFEYRRMYRSRFEDWSAIETFEVWNNPTSRNTQLVAWTYNAAYAASRGAARGKHASLDMDGALPDTYGKSAPALAEMLNDRLVEAHGNLSARRAHPPASDPTNDHQPVGRRRAVFRVARDPRFLAAVGLLALLVTVRASVGRGNIGAGCTTDSIRLSGLYGVLAFSAAFLLGTLITRSEGPYRGQKTAVKAMLVFGSPILIVLSAAQMAGLHAGLAGGCG